MTELCSNGDLLQYIRQQRKTIMHVRFHHFYRTFFGNAILQPTADSVIRFKDLLSFAWQISDGLVSGKIHSKSFTKPFFSQI